MLVVEPDHETNDEGEWGLEWTVIGQSGGGNDEQVDEETKNGKPTTTPAMALSIVKRYLESA